MQAILNSILDWTCNHECWFFSVISANYSRLGLAAQRDISQTPSTVQYHTTHNQFTALFPGLTEADTQTSARSATPSGPTTAHLHHPPFFYSTGSDSAWNIACCLLLYRSLNAADDATGMTPLQVAIETENVDCIREMVLCGAQVDAVDRTGRTVFHYAARCSNEMIIQVCWQGCWE